MSKFLQKFGWFLALVILLNLMYLLVLVLFSPGFKKIYQISQIRNQKFEVLALGNSLALDGIDAEYLTKNGINTYNLAVAGSHVATSLLILEDYLKHNQKPKLVIVGLSAAYGKAYLNKVPFNNPEVEFFYHPNWKENITNPPLMNFQWLSVDLLKIIISKDHRNATLVKGQWKTKKTIPDNTVYKGNSNSVIDYTDPYLSKIVDLCRKNRINIILTELPGSNNTRNDLPFVYEATLKDNTKFPVFNLNNYAISSGIIDSSKDWLGVNHLNQFGGEKITRYLLENVIHNSEITKIKE